jgi:hypothetical protein
VGSVDDKFDEIAGYVVDFFTDDEQDKIIEKVYEAKREAKLRLYIFLPLCFVGGFVLGLIF